MVTHHKSSLDHNVLRPIALDAIVLTTEHLALSLERTTRAVGADNASIMENVTGCLHRDPERGVLCGRKPVDWRGHTRKRNLHNVARFGTQFSAKNLESIL